MYADRTTAHRLSLRQPAAGLTGAILFELHDPPYSEHPGTQKMLKIVQRFFWWPGFTEDVKEFVKNCPTCQRNKSSTQKPAGELHPLPIPEAPWREREKPYKLNRP
eukprot:351314-Chlamydomonas_euryale.AAC.3